MIQYNTRSNIMKGIKFAKGLFSKVFTVVKVLHGYCPLCYIYSSLPCDMRSSSFVELKSKVENFNLHMRLKYFTLNKSEYYFCR